jgi:predicted membrane-bound spermidine synthase
MELLETRPYPPETRLECLVSRVVSFAYLGTIAATLLFELVMPPSSGDRPYQMLRLAGAGALAGALAGLYTRISGRPGPTSPAGSALHTEGTIPDVP